MFAVPGFSSLSSASLKSSFGKPPDASAAAPPVTGSNGIGINTSSRSNGRKRKRSQVDEKASAVDISSENIGELWTRVVEGKTATSGPVETSKSNEAGHKEKGARKDKKEKNKKNKKAKRDGQTVNKGSDHELEHEASLDVSNGENRSTGAQSGPQIDPGSDASGRMKNNPKRNNGNKTGGRDEKPHTKEQKANDKKQRRSNGDDPFADALSATIDASNALENVPKAPTLTPLQEKMRQKLSGARFRHLNQLLYTTPSPESLALFKSQPEMFRDYHAGFRQQVESWPENPVDIYIKRLFSRGKLRDSGFRGGKNKANVVSSVNANPLGAPGFDDAMQSMPLPRAKDGYTTVIDLGCGEAALAKAVTSAKPRPKIKIHSYDLHAPNSLVTVADIANLPLADNSIDIAVFCLALMGTNWPKMIEEAIRVLRPGGEVWVAEIKSRFARTKTATKDTPAPKKNGMKGRGKKTVQEDSNPADAFVEEQEDEVDHNRWAAGEQNFVDALARKGLRLKSRIGSNKMFVLLDFEKVGGRGGHTFQIPPKPDMHGRISKRFHTDDVPEVDEASILQPCLYKIR